MLQLQQQTVNETELFSTSSPVFYSTLLSEHYALAVGSLYR